MLKHNTMVRRNSSKKGGVYPGFSPTFSPEGFSKIHPAPLVLESGFSVIDPWTRFFFPTKLFRWVRKTNGRISESRNQSSVGLFKGFPFWKTTSIVLLFFENSVSFDSSNFSLLMQWLGVSLFLSIRYLPSFVDVGKVHRLPEANPFADILANLSNVHPSGKRDQRLNEHFIYWSNAWWSTMMLLNAYFIHDDLEAWMSICLVFVNDVTTPMHQMPFNFCVFVFPFRFFDGSSVWAGALQRRAWCQEIFQFRCNRAHHSPRMGQSTGLVHV